MVGGGGPGNFFGGPHRRAILMDNSAELTAGALRSDAQGSLDAARELFFTRGYPDYQTMIREEAKLPAEQRMDYVTIVTPNDSHHAIAKAALEAGFAVLCEKPLTLTLEEAQDLVRLAKAKSAPFISRGDRSGTHSAELNLWKAAGVDIAKEKADKTLGPWYREIGQGMGAALNTASASNAYALADRGTWLAFKNRGDLDILVAGDKRMFNQYGVILVNPAKHPHVKKDMGQAFVDWLVSPEGQKAIAGFKIGGEQLFFANADTPGA